MRTFLALTASLMLFAACGPTPDSASNPAGGTGTGTGTSTGAGGSVGGSVGGSTSVAGILSSKQSYANFLSCIKAKAKAEDQAEIQTAIDNIKNIPDSSWAIISATVQASAQAYLKIYTGC